MEQIHKETLENQNRFNKEVTKEHEKFLEHFRVHDDEIKDLGTRT